MKLNFDYKGTKITYDLTYKKTKAISIKITEEGKVNVIAPIGTSIYAVMDKVKGNAPWIISELYRNRPQASQSQLLEQYTYLGKNYKLEIVTSSELKEIKVKMLRGKLVVETYTESTEEIRQAIIDWYKQKVNAKIKERLKAYKELFEMVPAQVEVMDDNTILFRSDETCITANVRVGIMPVEIIDYILVSSLCRINGLVDGKEVGKMEEIIPSFEKSKEWLEENKNKLTL